MSCFWKGILNGIDLDHFRTIFPQYKKDWKPRPTDFVYLLKDNVKPTYNVKCNGKALTDNEIKENIEWIKNIDPTRISDGYYCSTCDPVLLLISEIFKMDIIHHYKENTIIYSYNGYRQIDKTLKVGSDDRHFWAF